MPSKIKKLKRPAGPIIHVKRKPPTPSSAYSVIWKFASERQNIYYRRIAGDKAPWTSDHILTSFRFTNAFRAADRVSQYLLRLTYSGSQDIREVFFRVILFKIFNKIETWEALEKRVGPLSVNSFDIGLFSQALKAIRAGGEPIYSNAYIMPTSGVSGEPKHLMHLALIKSMLDASLYEKIANSRTLEEAYELLLAFPSIGRFLAFQYSIDFNYTSLMNHSEMDFVVPGPGAIDGLSKCFENFGDYSPSDVIKWLTENQADEFKRFEHHFQGLWGRPLHLIDMQNVLCEVSKYTRVSHPDILGVSGRTRIKQRFCPHGQLPEPFFPPKWALNDLVSNLSFLQLS